MLEAGGLWSNPGVPVQGGSPLHPNNCDRYNSAHCGAGGGGGPSPISGGASPPTTAGAGPKRMKKMKEK